MPNDNERWQAAFEATYGFQEGGDIAPAPFFITEDVSWNGANLNLRYSWRPDVSFNLRGGWFKDEEGANVLWAGAPGDVYAIKANATWDINYYVRI